jgi:hypothetical protein
VAQQREGESSCDVGKRERESGRRCNRERERVTVMSAMSREQRERVSSGREWRKKNDENLWNLDLESDAA